VAVVALEGEVSFCFGEHGRQAPGAVKSHSLPGVGDMGTGLCVAALESASMGEDDQRWEGCPGGVSVGWEIAEDPEACGAVFGGSVEVSEQKVCACRG
jgi:hypothetical protein